MAIISVNNSSNLYWLGRYTERVYTTLGAFFKYYDIMLDKDKNSYKEFLTKLGAPDKYGSPGDFIRGFLYGYGAEGSGGFSIMSSFRNAFDNALTIRDVIGSEALSYIQMAADAFHLGRDSKNPRLALMPVTDYLLAFWGSIENKLSIREPGTIIKCGKLVERLDLYFRFSYDYKLIRREYKNLSHILSHMRQGAPYVCNAEQMAVLNEVVSMKASYAERLQDALNSLNRLFEEQSA
jgi:uncharacterized alpha-E superfamily protein